MVSWGLRPSESQAEHTCASQLLVPVLSQVVPVLLKHSEAVEPEHVRQLLSHAVHKRSTTLVGAVLSNSDEVQAPVQASHRSTFNQVLTHTSAAKAVRAGGGITCQAASVAHRAHAVHEGCRRCTLEVR